MRTNSLYQLFLLLNNRAKAGHRLQAYDEIPAVGWRDLDTCETLLINQWDIKAQREDDLGQLRELLNGDRAVQRVLRLLCTPDGRQELFNWNLGNPEELK